MSYYEDVYLKRLNRFGNDYQARLQGQREKMFENLLLKSIYRVDFEYNNIMEPGLLERYKQDDTQTLQYLLTRLDLKLPGGTVLNITDQNGNTNNWMIYWLEYIETSGYNKYIVLKMTHTIQWTHELGAAQPTYFSSLGYFYGKQRDVLRDKEYNKSIDYFEQVKENTLIMPINANLRKDDYFELSINNIAQGYRVTGFDNQSTSGVEFVTLDPVYKFDKTPTPVKPAGDTSHDYDWFTGDVKEV